jgi:hypothetical protein
MRLLVVFALFLAPSIAFPAQGETSYTIVKPGRCPSLVERFLERPSDYQNQPGKYYVYAGKHHINDLIAPSNNQEITHRRIAKRDVLTSFQGRRNVDRVETYFDNNPMSISYSVTENGMSYSWNEADQRWIESKAFPEMADGLELIMHQEGIMNTPYRFRGLRKFAWGFYEYSDVMAIEMGNPELLTPDTRGGKTERTMTSKSYSSKRQGFIGYETRNDMKFTTPRGVVLHTRTLNVETLVEILDHKPAGLAGDANP